jgi:twitching motility protein PilJ
MANSKTFITAGGSPSMATSSAAVSKLHSTSNKLTATAVFLIIIGFIGAGFSAFTVFRDAGYDQRYLELAGDLRLLSQQITTSSRESISGDPQAFVELDKARVQFTEQLKVLQAGNDDLPPAQKLLNKEMNEMIGLWNQVNKASATIIGNKDKILLMHEVAKTLNQSIPELQGEFNDVVDILIDTNAPVAQVAKAQQQSWLAERIVRNVDKMLAGGADAKEARDQFNQDAILFGKVLEGMIEGNQLMVSRVTNPQALKGLKDIRNLFRFVSDSVDEIFQSSSVLENVRKSADLVQDNSPKLLEATSKLTDRINNLDSERPITVELVLGFTLLILVALALMGFDAIRKTNASKQEAEETNERNQTAILRLLDELADLADGDLTTTATVSEDFTGAIADSINFTIDQLRILVSQINQTAVRVSTAADETRSTALQLAEASEHQSQEIAGASAAINEMAVTIDQVSSNALESASVAKRSVAIANNGAQVVQNTIKGMDNIREQIQETSKRIKRLGESSQEIGDIVGLINDIADQTNILALNAAIQASMAGDAGRGFAVVADEVQRLAERSSAATKQIEALVRTIQSDTNEAVISMEQTTSEVVRGARLAQDAGTALEEIETVSQELSELIQNISNAARQQAASAGHVSTTMNVIQEITQQTNAGTTATARSIGNLASLAQELKQSVSGFKLPGEATVSTENSDAAESEDFDVLETEHRPTIAVAG